MNNIRGVVCTLFGGILWGFSGACGQYIFSHYQLKPIELTFFRMTISGVILLTICAFKEKSGCFSVWRSVKNSVQVSAFAIFGIMFSQVTYLETISRSNAGTATVLQYTGPCMLVLLVCLMKKRLPTVREISALILATSGTFILATHGNPSALALSPSALVWGLLSAVALVLYTTLPEKLMLRFGALEVTGWAMLTGGVILGIFLRVWNLRVQMGADGWICLLCVALLGTAAAYTLYLQGVADIGPVKASMLASVEPLSATLFSVFWLKSEFRIPDLIGFVCIIATVFLLAREKDKKRKSEL